MSNEIFLNLVDRINAKNITAIELVSAADSFKAAGKNDLVIELYKLWIQQNQDSNLLYAVYFNLSVALSDVGSFKESEEILKKTIEVNPDFYPAYINLGTLYERIGAPKQGIVEWVRLAQRLNGVSGNTVDFKVMALKQIGRVFERQGQMAKAEMVLRESLEILPHQSDVIQHYVAMRLAQCEWPVLVPPGKMKRKDLMKNMGPLSMAIYTDDPMLQLGCAYNYSKNLAGYPENDFKDKHSGVERDRKKSRLRIGYVSSDLRHHAVGYQMAEMFGVHDRDKFEVFIYYCGMKEDDDIKVRIRSSVEHWLDINGMSDVAVAQRIVDDGIDILVDVNGYTKEARVKLFALRPAPIIANWFGYPGSAASPVHNYIIADDWIIPQEYEKYYTEKIVRLPCYQPNDRKRTAAEHHYSRAEVGLPEGAFVYCCFNGLQKISRFTFERWIAILSSVPDSVLWILAGSDDVHQRLREYAEKHGVSGARLIFAEKIANPYHLARYRLADLFLDTSPYGAHVTAADSLWMGVPILTFSGRGFATRVCSSLTRAAGLPEMVCSSPEEYVERAIELGSNKAKVEKLKAKLLANRDKSILFNTDLLVRSLEDLYKQMWNEYVSGKLPQPDLANLETYLEVGDDFDHDKIEMLAVENYEELYRNSIERRHKYYPIPADTRLWTHEGMGKTEKGLSCSVSENGKNKALAKIKKPGAKKGPSSGKKRH